MPLSTVQLARLTTLSLLSALLVAGLSPGAQHVQAQSLSAANPAISLTAIAGLRGYRVVVSGRGFALNSTITLAVDGSSGQACTADATGSFSSCAYTVPAQTGGTHTLTASDGIANSAAALYTAPAVAGYTNPAPPASVTSSAQATNTGDIPTVSLSSGAGKVGSNIAVSGSGFAPYQYLTLSFDGSSISTDCSTNANGSFRYCALTIPAAAAGLHIVTASDDSANSGSASYTVNPALSLSPSTGAAGRGAAINGSGFDAYARITVSFDGNTVSTSCIADASGSIRSCAYTVPAAPEGPHTVTASDGTTSAAAMYTIGPAFSLNVTAGTVGSPVLLSGSNYTPDSSLTVTFEGTALRTSGTCITDAKGNLPASNNCAFTVPPATAGIYNVTTSDGTYSGTTPFTVNSAISLTASAGAVGGGAAVSGSGFASFDPITVSFDGNNVSTDCTANASGSFRYCTLTVPDATGGTHTVTVTDPHGNSASASYTVNPAISRIARAGAVGSSAAISGSGFKANATITVTFDGNSVSTNCTTDATGSFSPCAFTVPAKTTGIHTVMASDGSENSATVIYTVTPAISLNATAGTAGSTVLLSGSNYTPNSTLTVTFDGAALRTSGICTTDASGNLPASNNCAVTVPATAAGSYTVTVSDGTYTGSSTFTVNPALRLIPSAGPAGSGAGVTGSGFAPFSTIAVTFDGNSVGTSCIANAKGSISYCAFTVPARSVGSYSVTASDSTGYSASAVYTVTPALSLNPVTITRAIRLSPSAGAVGSRAAVNGSGFAPNAPIALTFDGSSVATICTADASGSFSNCTFTVPAAPAGPHTVTASDGTTTGTTSYTVKPALSLATSAGAVGSSATVSGSGFAPNAPIALTFDGSSVSTSCTANGSGSFSNCTFTVPATATAGIHTVAATDKSANFASARLVV
jgi:flagellar basal body rod protein FlgG